ncbi:MAG: flavin reductase family protein, partial [Nocardioides sp.]
MTEVSDDAFDILMAAADPPLIVVTTGAEDEQAGCLVGFHVQSSITPQHYCVWLSKANHTYRVALRAKHFAVHFLTRADLPIAERFGTRSGEDTDKFAGLDIDLDDNGVPLLAACPNRMA